METVPNRWYAILDPREVPRGKPLGVQRLGHRLVLWRTADGVLHCTSDVCPHRGAALSLGKLEGDCIACPFHGFTFDASGRCTQVPAHPKMKIPSKLSVRSWAVREAHDLVWLFNGEPEDAPDTVPFFDLHGWSWAGSQFTAVWNTHYTRAIENQLDFSHLAFVHATTIGRYAEKQVDTLETEVEGDLFRVTGQGTQLEVLGPNIWRLKLSDKLHQFLAFVPIDEEHTLFYVRAYQRIVTVPGFDALVGLSMRLTNPFVLRQDQAVVESQRPLVSALTNGELYVASDKPIVAFLRWRQRLIKAATPPQEPAS